MKLAEFRIGIIDAIGLQRSEAALVTATFIDHSPFVDPSGDTCWTRKLGFEQNKFGVYDGENAHQRAK